MNSSVTKFDESKISINALKVVKRLKQNGYQAYLVGGCVRDLLLGMQPKDFDIATNAHPGEIKALFRNSRIVGRRFKIVHVRFGRELVEVTTFRGPHDDKYDENHTDQGMTVSDNIYGTFEDDALRRDFAMNALYFDTGTGEMLDMVNGADDIRLGVITVIGDPDKRFREDPVRMLRAIRFMAKLDFELHESSRAGIKALGHLLQDVAAARLYEEVLKLFMGGFGVDAWINLVNNGLHTWLFPETGRSLKSNAEAGRLIELALGSTDSRIANDLPVTPAFIFAALFWHAFIAERERQLVDAEMSGPLASQSAADLVLAQQQAFTAIPRWCSMAVKDIWFLQFRLPTRVGKKPEKIVAHKRFRAAYDFLLLREEAGAKTDNLGSWWTEYQDAADERRQEMTQLAAKPSNRKSSSHRSKGRRGRKRQHE